MAKSCLCMAHYLFFFFFFWAIQPSLCICMTAVSFHQILSTNFHLHLCKNIIMLFSSPPPPPPSPCKLRGEETHGCTWRDWKRQRSRAGVYWMMSPPANHLAISAIDSWRKAAVRHECNCYGGSGGGGWRRHRRCSPQALCLPWHRYNS